MDVADVVQQRGGRVDALAQIGDVGRRDRLVRGTLRRSPSRRRRRGPSGAPRRRGRSRDRVARRRSHDGRGSGGPARGARDRQAVGRWPPPRRGSRVARPCAPPARGTGPSCGGRGRGAQGWFGVGARQVQGLVDPVHGVGVAVSREPVAAERGGHRERAFGARLSDRPAERGVEVVDLGVERREMLPARRRHGAPVRFRGARPARGSSDSGARAPPRRRRQPRGARRRTRGSSRASPAGWARARAGVARAGSWRRGRRACRGRRR